MMMSSGLSSMTKAQLIEYAESIGIELDMSMTKAEMLEVLEGANNDGENNND